MDTYAETSRRSKPALAGIIRMFSVRAAYHSPMPHSPLLAPIPKLCEPQSGLFRVSAPVTVYGDGATGIAGSLSAIVAAALRVARVRMRRGTAPGVNADGCVSIHIAPNQVAHPQGYQLRVTRKQVRIVAGSMVGAYYAAQTLRQWAFNSSGAIRCVEIHDQPDFAIRGIMLDISRDKVPTMATLFRLIDAFAALKLNQLQLYTEHTFAYCHHREVWRSASPLTAAQIRRLDAYCRARFIELVPNQNCFGHMERWLKHERHAPLAEATGPTKDPWGGIRDTRTTLCPIDPRSLRLVKSLLKELLPLFGSKQVNVGCDETWELGQGRSRQACETRGKGRIYLDFLLGIYNATAHEGRAMQFWADIIHEHPELIAELPKDVIPLEWGYEADHPFDEHNQALRAAGLTYYVCPGTSSWCSYAGRTTNALQNLRRAAVSGLKHGATGYLMTDWGDGGHHQYLPVSYGPIVYGASVAWAERTNRAMDAYAAGGPVFLGEPAPALMQAWKQAGDVYRHVGLLLKNQSALFRVMQTRWNRLCQPGTEPFPGFAKVTEAKLRKVENELDRIAHIITGVQTRGAEARLCAAELRNTLTMLRHACMRWRGALQHRAGAFTSRQRQQLIRHMRGIMFKHDAHWRMRNRSGGLRDSMSRLKEIHDDYARMSAITEPVASA